MPNIPYQIHKLERLLEEIHDQAIERLGHDDDLTHKIMMAYTRSFGLLCDIEQHFGE